MHRALRTPQCLRSFTQALFRHVNNPTARISVFAASSSNPNILSPGLLSIDRLPYAGSSPAARLASSMASDQEVLFYTGREGDSPPGAIGTAVLNRPKSLNALTESMCKVLHRLYDDWEASPDVHAIVIRGAGGKAFCAGGDVKGVVQMILAGRQAEALSFFRKEYTLNFALGQLKKPHIAILDGIVMGGGAGVSMHGPFRVATEKTVFAMPECGIGLFPDVGASHFLPQLPGDLGTYIGLTGRRLKGIEMLEAGLATHYVALERLPELEERLHGLGAAARDPTEVGRVLQSVQDAGELPTPSGLLEQLPAISKCFSGNSLEDIYGALRARGDAWSQETLATLSKLSPLSQKVTLREVREGAGRSLAHSLRMEFRQVHNCIYGRSDFVEGIRALLIDKTGDPKWDPPAIEQVTPEMVDAFFRPLQPDQELDLRQPLVQQHSAVSSRL